MGINGLLPFLENSSKSVNISQFRGCTAAVDSYCWLHKGAFGCSEKLARGEDTNGYVLYCLKYLRVLQNAGVRVIMVFDGQHLPAKRETEKKRGEQRRIARKRAAELLRLDKANEARNYLRQCIDVTHEMALALIKECRQMGVDCIVAPYEADAQLAYFSIKKIVDVVITEDSDLVLFGCDKVLFKLDMLGNGTLVEKEKLYLSMQMSPDIYNFDKFRYMCILSGCDYIQSLPGIGLKKALKFIKTAANPDIYLTLTKLPSYLNMRQIVVTDEYREEFMVALATFKHQIVYDPLQRKLVHLTDPEDSGTQKEHCKNAGELFDEVTAFQLALGNLNPFSLEKVDDWNPDKVPLKLSSIWSKDYKKIEPKTKQPSPSLLKKVKSTKNIDVIVEVKNLFVDEEDDDLKKELQIYKLAKVEQIDKVNCKANEQEETIIKSVLNERKLFNPFIKENKTVRTTINKNRIVRSRYFCKTNSDVQQIGLTTIDSEKDSTLQEQNGIIVVGDTPAKNDEKKSSRENIDTLCDIISMETDGQKEMQTETTSNKVDIKEKFSLKKIKRKMVILDKTNQVDNKRTSNSISTQEDSETNERLSLDKRKRSISIDEEVDDDNDSNVENLTPPLVESTVRSTTTVVKKSNIGLCRSFGLQKKSAKRMPGKNQPTLLSMFAAIKK